MKYIGLRFKGVLKEQFREEFEPIATCGCWESAKDSVIATFAKVDGSSYIPFGPLNNMPNRWNSWGGDEIACSYDKQTGYWAFQCSMPYHYRRYVVVSFFKLLPYIVETVEFCELYHEDWDYSQLYGLVGCEMKLLTKYGVKYGKEGIVADKVKNEIDFDKMVKILHNAPISHGYAYDGNVEIKEPSYIISQKDMVVLFNYIRTVK